MNIDLNIRTIDTLLSALQIAKESSQIEYSKNQLTSRLKTISNPIILEEQAVLIDSLEEYEKLIDLFTELRTRQNNVIELKEFIKS